MASAIKTIVSKKKRRYIDDGFNLDLTYISDRVIAMGFPSENMESIYRNSMEEVRRLLEQKHKDHYKIYNLCSERSYDIAKFHNRVATYPFDDHNPPEFSQMRPFCEDVDKWLDDDKNNVAVVHCKAGKGRTGLMICAYLLHRKSYPTAREVLEYYGAMRTQDMKGVTIPSQRRYVEYYAMTVSEGLQYNPVKMYLTSIVIEPSPTLGITQQDAHIQFEVRQTSVRPYESQVYVIRRSDDRINLQLDQPLLIVGDVKIDFTQQNKVDFFNMKPHYVGKTKLFHFWINTFFIDRQKSSPLTHSFINVSPDSANATPHVVHPARSPRLKPRDLAPSLSIPMPEDKLYEFPRGEDLVHSPNGTCQMSVQTIQGHPPARTVSIVDSVRDDVYESDSITNLETNLTKHVSISDDHLLQEQARRANQDGGAGATSSFISSRERHKSVPETTRTAQSRTRLAIPGKQVSVRLNKSQIDKAAKDKSGKFSENFNVTLFLTRPNDQTLQAEFSRPNRVCQGIGIDSWPSGRNRSNSSEESSDEETDRVRPLGTGVRFGDCPEARGGDGMSRGGEDMSGMVRNRTEPATTHTSLAQSMLANSGMVRNRTEPTGSLSTTMSVSQSTWI